MADKDNCPSIEKILDILDKLASQEEKSFIKDYKAKYLAIVPEEYLKLDIKNKKKFIFNFLNTKTDLNAQFIEFILVLVENMNTKRSNIYIIDRIVDIIIEYNKIKNEKEKLWNKLLEFSETSTNSNEIRYSVNEIMSLLYEFSTIKNNEYLYKQVDKLNYKIKDEFENYYNKIIELYKGKYKQYKLKYEMLIFKTNQMFPNKSFQNKMIRQLNKIQNSFKSLKQSIFYGKKWKSYGICCRNINFINKCKRNINKYSLEDEISNIKLELNDNINTIVNKLDENYKTIYKDLNIKEKSFINSKLIANDCAENIKVNILIKFLENQITIDRLEKLENLNSNTNDSTKNSLMEKVKTEIDDIYENLDMPAIKDNAT